MPIVEKVAERLDSPGLLARIDKLELDFGIFDPQGKNEEALKNLESGLEDKLARLIQNEAQFFQSSEPELNGANRFNVQNRKQKSSSEYSANKTEEEDLFIYLLQYGCLPWWASIKQTYKLEKLAEYVLQQPGENLIKALQNLIQQPAARLRMAFNLPPETVEDIIQLSLYNGNEALVLLRTILKSPLLNQSEINQLKPYVLEKVLRQGQKPTKHQDFVLELSTQDSPNPVLPLTVKAILKKAETLAALNTGEAKGDKRGNETDAEKSGLLNKNNIKGPKKSIQDKTKSELKPDFENEVAQSPSTSTEVGEKFFVNNAGLVILFNYLPAFFEVLGLTKNKIFVNREAMQRGVYLLQYLAQGEVAEYQEHVMLLNKIACGMPLHEPLTLQFEITETEKQECQALLQAVATNWSAIGKTSGEGMRDAFLVRDGLLEQQTNGWNLKIEKNTIDILVDRLPWSISIIKLPWSESLIFVDWT